MPSKGYLEVYTALQSGKLIPQAEGFLLMQVVPAILSEAANTPNHAERLAWAKGIENSESMRTITARRLVTYLVQNPTIAGVLKAGGHVEDTDIEYEGLQRLDQLIAQNQTA